MACDPHVSAARPIPVAAQPYVSGLRGYTDDLHLGRWGGHIDCAADVDHRGCRDPDGASDHATAQQCGGGKCREYQGSIMSSFH